SSKDPPMPPPLSPPSVSPPPGRWWAPLLKDTPSDQLLATKDGTIIRVLEPEDLKKGAVIELTNDTDSEAGPTEPKPTDPRIFIVTRNGEHYLETVALADSLSITMKMAEKDIWGSVTQFKLCH
ncbi:MAG: hypothetical protein ACKPKO_13790, partial [Candidatus Fonsibacter sp.]